MKMIVVTGGQEFTDIDVLACAAAYSELLKHEGKKSEVVLPGALNHSCTPMVRSWPIDHRSTPSESDSEYVVVDVSEPAYIAKCVDIDKVIEIYDHRYGFEDLWKDKLGADCHIESVGACATLIWEEYTKRGLASKISHMSANLLSVAIISNTLNFGAHVTHDRDIQAFNELKSRINMPEDWVSTYFKELQEGGSMGNIEDTIKRDTKTITVPGTMEIVMGQLELWTGKDFLVANKESVKRALTSYGVRDWFMSVPSISEKRNYVYAESPGVKEMLSNIVGAEFTGDVGITKRLWLRKEIRKKLLEMSISSTFGHGD